MYLPSFSSGSSRVRDCQLLPGTTGVRSRGNAELLGFFWYRSHEEHSTCPPSLSHTKTGTQGVEPGNSAPPWSLPRDWPPFPHGRDQVPLSYGPGVQGRREGESCPTTALPAAEGLWERPRPPHQTGYPGGLFPELRGNVASFIAFPAFRGWKWSAFFLQMSWELHFHCPKNVFSFPS